MADVAIRRGREGSKWLNQRPSGDEVAAWFASVRLHAGLEHEHYIGGVVLIQAKEKSDEVVGFDNAGHAQIQQREDLVLVPYTKVETRVAYFWDLMALHDDWVGAITPVAVPGADTLGLPPGYFRYTATGPDAKVVNFVGCSMQVTVSQVSRTTSVTQPVMSPPPGSKIVPAASKWKVDENALMKAETGAVGRALGMAGMLVLPGSGVATAEDMQEALYGPPAGAVPTLPDAPAAPVDTDEVLRERAAALVAELAGLSPKAHADFQAWALGRKLTLASAQGAVLRGTVRKLETAVEEARG